jgi:hypothetical protein
VRPDEIEEIAEAAAEKAVGKMMFNLGWDVSTNQAVEKVRADVAHVRMQREACETVKRHGLKTTITILGTFLVSVVGYLVMTFKGGGH